MPDTSTTVDSFVQASVMKAFNLLEGCEKVTFSLGNAGLQHMFILRQASGEILVDSFGGDLGSEPAFHTTAQAAADDSIVEAACELFTYLLGTISEARRATTEIVAVHGHENRRFMGELTQASPEPLAEVVAEMAQHELLCD